jgi:hypothetical protein
MSFTSTLPVNLPKYSLKGLISIAKVIICGVEVRYVKSGDVIDAYNHAKLYGIVKCLAGRMMGWSSMVDKFMG